ncbi:MAG: cysteine--tRNA ligase [Actinomycetota bacterium]|nr:cysteine--tRNA ligase [Actinomycetota bacterium]
MRTIYLHDTRTGKVRPVEPREPGKVGIYACGPTVYGRVHVGNARPFVVFSLLKRLLVHEGYEVSLVANITDVNDKIYAAAAAADIGSEQLAREMSDHYVADTDALGLGRPDHEPRASQTIGGIVELIERLIEGGHAYPAVGDVYFSVRSYPDYGELSHRKIGDMDQGEGGEGSDRKRDPLDFALWKANKPGEDAAWDSPWGRGRPGWHIECSAMAEALLGVDFEIHGGGSDLLFPHHENEAAQTRAARGAPLARVWMHNGMVRIDQEKMAKSVGNIFLLHSATEARGRDALLMFFCGAHYRQPIEFDDERLMEASARADRIREAGRRLVPAASPPWSAALRERFFEALRDDFNTPRGLAAVAEWVTAANRFTEPVGDEDLRAMLGVLGLENLLDADADAPQIPPEAVELLDARERARAARDWTQADRLREQLRALGWEVRDGPDGPELLPA